MPIYIIEGEREPQTKEENKMTTLDELKMEFKNLQDELADTQQTEQDLEEELWDEEQQEYYTTTNSWVK